MFDDRPATADPMGFFLRLRHRGLVVAASKRSPVDELPPATVQTLERIARSSGPLLRLPAEVEPHYREQWRITANHMRVLLAVLPALVFGFLLLLPASVLDMPEAVVELLRLLSLCVIIPTALCAAVVTWLLPQHAVSGAVIAAGGLVLLLAFEILRAKSAAFGYTVDHGLALAIPVALAVLGGFRFDRVLMIHAGYLAIVVGGIELGWTPPLTTIAWVAEGGLLLVSAMAALWMETTQRRSWAARRLLTLQVHQDTLTSLRNRRAFELHFELAAAQARRDGCSMLFALADLDHFKLVNDRYGHAYGDGALSEVGVVLGQFGRRPLDLVARLGGEEFAILLYDCDPAAAETRLQALVDQVRGLGIDNHDAPLRKLTISAGGVISDGRHSLSLLYRSADAQLYKVKRGGRNGARIGPVLDE
ncbi:GGDEF domain-containing protein [Sinimarinibacterium thermocellulolyticum]|uniref:diguanylate cyclase n=1 Tax=Sinimarinibacterium thermocellulolyticum TaxID=3170016 RepID=A0ABV2A678_9GAMM